MDILIFLEIINVLIISFIVIVLFARILINFMMASGKKTVKKEKKSIVETGSMIGFFFLFYLVIRFRIGIIENSSILLRIFLMFTCWIILLFGLWVNMAGRKVLGKNWANQVRIYKHQTFVTKGVYSIVRHPLYASLIWMFYAASIIYLNWLAFILNTLVFIPFMYYRAKQEEKLLGERFKEYKNYKNKVGMFFPKLIKRG